MRVAQPVRRRQNPLGLTFLLIDALAHRCAVFGDVVALSLGPDWRMESRQRAGEPALEVALPRRSLLVLEGEARSRWQHRIPEVRATRIAVSYRAIRR
jgi:alkylated DNA repair dioxygenase AlkB